jgi:CheY-like chemotaxis protein
MTYSSGKPSILIVENQEAHRIALRFIFENDYELRFARDGREAIAQVTTKSPDLVLMDVFLPLLNGWEAAKAIRTLGYVGPIVMTTAFPFEEDSERVRDFGVSDYVLKPFDLVEFAKTVKQLISVSLKGRSCPSRR